MEIKHIFNFGFESCKQVGLPGMVVVQTCYVMDSLGSEGNWQVGVNIIFFNVTIQYHRTLWNWN